MAKKSVVPKTRPEDGKYTCSDCGKTVTDDEVVKTQDYVFHPECHRRFVFEQAEAAK